MILKLDNVSCVRYITYTELILQAQQTKEFSGSKKEKQHKEKKKKELLLGTKEKMGHL